MIPFTCPCCEVDRPPHRDGCSFHNDCPTDAEVFDEVSALRSEVARLREDRRWIPVVERLPEEGQEVLCACSIGNIYAQSVVVFCIDDLGVTVWEDDDGVIYRPTHWQPLPAPPKGGEGEG